MDSKTKVQAVYAILILIAIACFAIENKIITFIALGGLVFLGFVIESVRTKD